MNFIFRARRELGEVFRIGGTTPGPGLVITCHPDHVRALFRTPPDEAHSMAGEGQMRPIVGPNTVLTATGDRHRRQRRLLSPLFHGQALERYEQLTTDAVTRHIARWPLRRSLPLFPRMREIMLDVILAGVFGVGAKSPVNSSEYWLRSATKHLLSVSTWSIGQLSELLNFNRKEAGGVLRVALAALDRPLYRVIAKRAEADDLDERWDVLSLLLRTGKEGRSLTPEELRDELLTLLLVGHETTATSLAWTWERLVHNPGALDRLCGLVRDGGDSEAELDAVIRETLRCRPAVAGFSRRLKTSWRFGPYRVPADTPLSVSSMLLHHREDLYPDPFSFRPERWLGHKPGSCEWIPFGGGPHRCLGAALAVKEHQLVLQAMVQQLDVEADDPAPERVMHRYSTMLPARGARVRIRGRRRSGQC